MEEGEGMKFEFQQNKNERNFYRLLNPKYKNWQFIGIKKAFKKNKYNVPDVILAFPCQKGLYIPTNLKNKKIFEVSLMDLEQMIEDNKV